MANQEIPREQWRPVLDNFSKRHQGWITTVEVVGDIGDQHEADGRPLLGISADTKDRENYIEVMVGDRPDEHVTHIINSPKRLWLKPAGVLPHEAIEVESEDGTMTLVTFNHVESPDHLLPA
ncbi:MAG TPA: DUF5335 family protein [Bryobacteraceae bacterium]|nr:DUF5335 family protein [Bryobacteraceae bacterium]